MGRVFTATGAPLRAHWPIGRAGQASGVASVVRFGLRLGQLSRSLGTVWPPFATCHEEII